MSSSLKPPALSQGCRGSCLTNFGSPALAILIPHAGFHVANANMKFDGKWYESLIIPKWMPPPWVFAAGWTAGFTAVGYASYLVWKNGGSFGGPARLPLLVYGGHLVLNWAWTPIFFNMKRLDYALYDTLALDAVTALTAYMFYKIDQTAGLIFLPYLAWLGLGTALSFSFHKNNPRVKITEVKED